MENSHCDSSLRYYGLELKMDQDVLIGLSEVHYLPATISKCFPTFEAEISTSLLSVLESHVWNFLEPLHEKVGYLLMKR